MKVWIIESIILHDDKREIVIFQNCMLFETYLFNFLNTSDFVIYKTLQDWRADWQYRASLYYTPLLHPSLSPLSFFMLFFLLYPSLSSSIPLCPPLSLSILLYPSVSFSITLYPPQSLPILLHLYLPLLLALCFLSSTFHLTLVVIIVCSHPLQFLDENDNVAAEQPELTEENQIGVKRAAKRKLEHELGISMFSSLTIFGGFFCWMRMSAILVVLAFLLFLLFLFLLLLFLILALLLLLFLTLALILLTVVFASSTAFWSILLGKKEFFFKKPNKKKKKN